MPVYKVMGVDHYLYGQFQHLKYLIHYHASNYGKCMKMIKKGRLTHTYQIGPGKQIGVN